MGWSTLILAIIQFLGPVLIEWLKKWLESRLHAASESLDFASFADENAARDAMFDAAIARSRGVRRLLLRRAKAHAAVAGVTSSNIPILTPEAAAELVDFAEELDGD
jgi:hypothetical protein